jgi:D-arabinose 5-phosphate isomerase GutQ
LNITKNIKFIAQDVLINKSCATEKRSQFFDNDFGECVNEIYSSKGSVGITGIGKNAIIANKIVASLKFTKSPVFLRQAADTIQGGLGKIEREGIQICLSLSSNSPEIKELVPLLKRRASKFVGRISKTNSHQAQEIDYIFNEFACKTHLHYWMLTAFLIIEYAFSVYLFQLRNFANPVAHELQMVPGSTSNDDFQRKLSMGIGTFQVNAPVKITTGLKNDYAHKSAVKQLDQTQENKDAQRVAMKNQNPVKPFIHTLYFKGRNCLISSRLTYK